MRFIFLLSIALLTSCNFSLDSVEGEGPVIKEERSISDFDEIELNTSADVYFKQSDNFTVEVETNENLMEYILTKKIGSKLIIDAKDGTSISTHDGMNIFISCPEINTVIVNGSGSFFANKTVKTSNLNCELSGSGDISFEKLICDSYSMEINGSGDINLDAGKSETGAFFINGSGNVYASNTKTENLDIQINGSGTVEASASKNLDVSVEGSGDVYYKGNPQKNIEINGSGSVEKM